MSTPIGNGFLADNRRRAWAFLVGTGTVAMDLALVGSGPTFADSQTRAALALVTLVALLLLVRGDAASLGLTTAPAPGWGFWCRATLWVGLGLGVLLAVLVGIWLMLGKEVPVYALAPSGVGEAFLRMCVLSPVIEEALYRLAFCAGAVAVLGRWGAVVGSGVLFAGLHWLYGNPSPENQVGGFILAWAFVRSGSILVPVGLHALGNGCALVSQVAAWYWLTPPGT
jgi:membrane protease YdiL (CAAX protease family)